MEFCELLFFDSLIDLFCFVYDIGYFFYGYGGEIVFNYMMCDYGGFEGNV